jgi:hypothetical protein
VARRYKKVEKDISTGALAETDILEDESHQNPKGKIFEIFGNYSKKFGLDHTVCLYMRAAFCFDESRANRCILETTMGDQAELWSGPLAVIVVKASLMITLKTLR